MKNLKNKSIKEDNKISDSNDVSSENKIKIKRSKKWKERVLFLKDKISGDLNKTTLFDEAIIYFKKMLEKFPHNFSETIEIIVNLNVNPKKREQNLKGVINYPFVPKIKKRLFLITEKFSKEQILSLDKKNSDLNIDKDSLFVMGRDIVSELQQQEKFLKKKKIDYVLIEKNVLPNLISIIPILGKQKLMASTENGTLFDDNLKLLNLQEKLFFLQNGKFFNFRIDEGGNICFPIGKSFLSLEALIGNYKEVIRLLKEIKPATVKVNYVKKIILTSTFSPGLYIKETF